MFKDFDAFDWMCFLCGLSCLILVLTPPVLSYINRGREDSTSYEYTTTGRLELKNQVLICRVAKEANNE